MPGLAFRVLDRGGEFLFHAFAYDAAYATYSPSRLFLEGLVRLCFDQGVRTFDFMPVEEAYKRIWATDYVRTESHIGPINTRGAMILRMAGLRRGKSMSSAPLKRLYRMLPGRLRDAVGRRLREFRTADFALSHKLIRDRPLEPMALDSSD